jgi:hypothetical protein
VIAPAAVVRSLQRRGDRVRRQAQQTPGRLQLLAFVMSTMAGGLCLISLGALVAAQRTVADMHYQSVPGIIEVQRIHATLADADRAVANAFLSGATEAVGPHRQYEADIAAAARELELAAEHDGGNQAISRQIQAISVETAQYTSLVDIARADNAQGYPVGAAYLRQASQLMHRPGDGILARVDQLGDLDADNLARNNVVLLVAAGLLVVYVGGAILLLRQLVRTQRYLRMQFKRRRNGSLLMATVLVVLLLAASVAEAGFTWQMLNVAQGQTYSRLLNLWHVRSVINDANGNESLALIARGNGDAFDRAFRSGTRRLADRPVTDVLVAQAASGDVGFNGLLADELNLSSGAERQAAMNVLIAYRQYMGVDATIRARRQAGDQESAARLALGSRPGQLGDAFARLDAAVGRTIANVQDQFDLTIAIAEYSLLGFAGLQFVNLGVGLLAFRGLKPRIDEYRV